MIDHDAMIDPKVVRTGELTKKIWTHFGPGYIKLTQIRAATGFRDENTADAMVFGDWPSTGNVLHGFEVKISRADWLNEVRNPSKNNSVKGYCNFWWLVIADENMVKPGELPDDWGMMIWQGGNKKLKVVKKAPKLEPQPLPNHFIASLMRHNEKETISIDLHNECLRDIRYEARAEEKKKSDDLHAFIREMHKGFGIVIKEIKTRDWRTERKIHEKWIAEIKGTIIGEMTAEQLNEKLTTVRLYDDMLSHFEWALKNMKEIRAKLPDDADDRIRVWLDWAIGDGEKIVAARIGKDQS